MLKKVILLFALVSALSSCHRHGELISRSDMARIYADMLLADQWIQQHKELRRTADTTLFYEPVFRKYGYTTQDYVYSVEHYMEDPVRYSRILKKTSSMLEARVRKIKAYQKAVMERDACVPKVIWNEVEVMDFSAVPDSLDVYSMIDSINCLLKVDLFK